MTDTYLVTSYPPPKDGHLKLLNHHMFSGEESTANLANAIRYAEEFALQGHSEVRVWSLHGSPELVQVVKWSQDS